MLEFSVKSFDELTTHELYDVLQLRSDVFMFEQNIILPDIDNSDQVAYHVLGKKDGIILAYARIFKPHDCYIEASFGRVVVKKTSRKFGYGHDLVDFTMKTIQEKFNTTTIKISAQSYLQKFYEYHGFEIIGEEHLEDKMPHSYMIIN